MNKPLTREERQLQTRNDLIDAARQVFAREGYHAARLDAVAAEAGYTKGAVYSNFAGKAELFLAVIDKNLDLALDEPDASLFDVLCDTLTPAPAEGDVARGFALATLEFMASAARDPQLLPEIEARLARQVTAFTTEAGKRRNANDELSAEELGFFLSALDQGISVHTLATPAPVQRDVYLEIVDRILRPR